MDCALNQARRTLREHWDSMRARLEEDFNRVPGPALDPLIVLEDSRGLRSGPASAEDDERRDRSATADEWRRGDQWQRGRWSRAGPRERRGRSREPEPAETSVARRRHQ